MRIVSLSRPAIAAALLVAATTGAVHAQTQVFLSTPGQPVPGGRIIYADGRTPARPATPLAQSARNAAIADGVTTGMALASGGAELHPLGAIASIAAKPLLIAYAKSLPEEKQAGYFSAFAATWSGAAANNLCVAASLVTAGGFAPACIAVGLAWGAKKWNDAEPERRYWSEECPRLRAEAANPRLRCAWDPRRAEPALAKAPRPEAVATAFMQPEAQ